MGRKNTAVKVRPIRGAVQKTKNAIVRYDKHGNVTSVSTRQY